MSARVWRYLMAPRLSWVQFVVAIVLGVMINKVIW